MVSSRWGSRKWGILSGRVSSALERETGFEPATPSLEGSCSSQLSYSRPRNSPDLGFVFEAARTTGFCGRDPASAGLIGGEGRIRTSEGVSQQIYSLPRLAASVPLRLAVVAADFGNLK